MIRAIHGAINGGFNLLITSPLRYFKGDVVQGSTYYELKDFTNTQNAYLVDNYCVNFLTNVTITLSIPRVGATVTQLNFGVDLNGVSINGSGHIVITQASLTNTKIWQLKLSTGDEFIFSTGLGVAYNKVYDIINGNTGTLSGTLNTAYSWSTQDYYPHNYLYGFNPIDQVINGNMELDSNWNNNLSPVSNVRSNEQAHSGTYSRKFVVNSAYDGITQTIQLYQGHSYKLTIWLYGDGLKYIARIQNRADAPNYIYATTTANGANGDTVNAVWTKFEVEWLQTTANYAGVLQIMSATDNITGTLYVDDVTLLDANNSVPGKRTNDNDALGNPIIYVSGNFHNGAETKIQINPTNTADLVSVGYSDTSKLKYSDLYAITNLEKDEFIKKTAFHLTDHIIYSSAITGYNLRKTCEFYAVDCRPGIIGWWQSNMVGRGLLSELSVSHPEYIGSHSNILTYNGSLLAVMNTANGTHHYPSHDLTTFSFWLPYLVDKGVPLVSIMHAVDGTAVYKNDTPSYQDWNSESTGEYLDTLKTSITQTIAWGKAANFVIDWQRIIHYGGETDGISEVSALVFDANYEATINELIAHVGDHNELKVIMIRPHVYQPYISYIRAKFAAMQTANPSKFVMVNTDDLNYGDNDHLNAQGQYDLSQRIKGL